MNVIDKERTKEILLSHIHIEKNGCWNWTASKNKQGYGNIGIGSRKDGSRKTAKAHRVAFYIFNNVDPDGFDVCHKCDNPSCINPEHLFLGTEKDNMQDMYKKGRQPRIPSHKHGSAKLTIEQVLEAKRLRKQGVSYYSMAKNLGVYRETIRAAVVGKTWKNIYEYIGRKPEDSHGANI